jgi:glyoxylase-like metal-dependent hydrolase (beta-lactamase superfamily II)
MPEPIPAGNRVLRPVPIPGHSVTHTALFDERSGVVLTGDLFLSSGVSAVMSHENPYESIASLRRVASISPRVMLSGHALTLENPAAALRSKADRIEQAAAQVVRLHADGLGTERIVRQLFTKGGARDRRGAMLTAGEFSRANFVRACLRHAGG